MQVRRVEIAVQELARPDRIGIAGERSDQRQLGGRQATHRIMQSRQLLTHTPGIDHARRVQGHTVGEFVARDQADEVVDDDLGEQAPIDR